jgi:hypothetical protein
MSLIVFVVDGKRILVNEDSSIAEDICNDLSKVGEVIEFDSVKGSDVKSKDYSHLWR